MLLTGLIFLILLGWGTAAFFEGLATKLATVRILMFWSLFLALPMAFAVSLFGVDFSPNQSFFIFMAFGAVAAFFAWVCYMHALKHGEISPVVVLAASYPLFSMILISIITTNLPPIQAWLGAFVILGGVYMLHGEDSGESNDSKGRSIFWGIVAAAFWGVWAVFDWKAMEYGNPIDMTFWASIFSLLFLVPLFFWFKKSKTSFQLEKKPLLLLFASVVFIQAASLLFYWALKIGSPEIVIIATSAYPIVTMWICIARGEEKIIPRRVLATLVIIAGVVLIQI